MREACVCPVRLSDAVTAVRLHFSHSTISLAAGYEGDDGLIKGMRIFAGNGVRGVGNLYAPLLGKALFQLVHDAMEELGAPLTIHQKCWRRNALCHFTGKHRT